MTLDFYQGLGVISIALLIIALGLSAYVLVGRRSRKVIYGISGTVLAMMIGISILCLFIYAEYGR